MRNSIKRMFTRVMSIVLAIAIIIPNVVSTNNFGIVAYGCDTSDATYDAYFELNNAILSSAGDWGTAIYRDHITPGYFHNEVIDYIVERSMGLYKKELPIVFPTPVTNPTTGKLTSSGRADLYTIDDGITYLWEVKPASYLTDDGTYNRKSKGEAQLQNYVNSNEFYENGKNYPDATPLIYLTGVFEIMAPSSAIYQVEFLSSGNGLVLYWFQRKTKPEEEKEKAMEEAKENAKYEVMDSGNELVEEEKRQESGDSSILDDTPSQQPQDRPQGESGYTFDSFGNIVDSNGQIFISRNKLAFYCVTASTFLAYFNKRITSINPLSSDLEGAETCSAFITITTNSKITKNAAAIVGAIPMLEILLENMDVDAYAAGIEEYDEEIDYEQELQDEIEDESFNYEKAGNANPPRDPLIIHFANTSDIEFTTLDDGVNFDLDKNGFAEKTAWTKNNDGFLTIDLNGNGIIDDGGELFGDHFIMPDGRISSTGFEALISLDEDDNKKIDENDSVFEELFVWFDTENKGFTDSNELKRLTELGVSYIDLNYISDTYEQEESGTRREETSYVCFNDGNTKRISEFWFPINSTDTTYDGEITVGNVPSIEQAIGDDETDTLYYLWMSYNNSSNIAIKRYYLKQILYYITGATNININSRGGNIDARDLHVIESFMGRDFEGVDGANPNINAANILKGMYMRIEDYYYNYLNLKSSFGGYKIGILDYIDSEGKSVFDPSFLYYFIDLKIAEKDSKANILIYDLGIYLSIYDNINATNEFEKYSEYYSSKSQDIAEIINHIGNTYTFVGTDMNDTYVGANTTNFIFGDDGDDVLNGSKNADHIYGGFGNDTLKGNICNDIYYIDLFHGNDVIYDTNGDNKLVFAEGLSFDDYAISVSTNGGFTLTNKHTDETISLPDFLTNPLNYDFIFNGETQTLGGGESREVIEGTAEDNYLEAGDGFNVFYGGDGNDTLAGGANMDFMYGENSDDLLLGRNGVNVLFGGTGNDTIYDGDDGSYLNGGDGDDSLYGGGGADVLDGGAGNDYLQADHGNDTYVFGKGYDADTINASSDLNTVIIHGYRSTDMINTRNAHNDLIINFKNSDDCLIIDHFFDYNSNRDFNFVFDDGTVLGQYDITAKYAPIDGTDADEWLAIQNSDDGIIHGNGGNDGVSGGSGNDELYGDSGDDTLYGNDGNDILDGGTGTDGLNGGNGTDTYIFAKGYGNDTVNEWGSDHSIIKLTDINSDEVTVTDQYGSNLLLSVIDTEDTLVISNFKWGQATYTFEFADGAVATVNIDIF